MIVIIGASEWNIHSHFAAILAPGHIQLNQKCTLKEEAENTRSIKEKSKRGKLSLCTYQFWVSIQPSLQATVYFFPPQSHGDVVDSVLSRDTQQDVCKEKNPAVNPPECRIECFCACTRWPVACLEKYTEHSATKTSTSQRGKKKKRPSYESRRCPCRR